MPYVNRFDGGLSKRIDPTLIKINEAQHLFNVDPDPITLKSAKTFTSTNIPAGSFAKKFNGVWLSSDIERHYLEYSNVLYYTQKIGGVKYYSKNSEYKLGIVKPTNTMSFEVYTSTGSLKASTVQYTLTYYNATMGHESANSDYSEEIVLEDNNSVNITKIPQSSDPQVTNKRLYRLGGNLTNPTMIAELANTTNNFVDNISDTDATIILDTQKNYPPDPNMQFLTEAYSIFFGLVGNEIRFSDIDAPYAWPPENSFKLRENGKGLLVIPQGILIFTDNLTYMLKGTNISEFNLILLSEHQGCVNGNTCNVVKNSPLWVSYDGLCTVQNGYVQVVSRSLLGKITLDVKQSVVYDDQYFLLKKDGTLLVFDLRYGYRFYELNYSKEIDGLTISEGKLYFISSGTLNEAFTGDSIQLEYTSPIFTEGDYTHLKSYNKIDLKATGTFTVNLYIDNELVLTENIDGDDLFTLTPSATLKLGYSCHLNIVGVGTIHSINIKPLGV